MKVIVAALAALPVCCWVVLMGFVIGWLVQDIGMAIESDRTAHPPRRYTFEWTRETPLIEQRITIESPRQRACDPVYILHGTGAIERSCVERD